LSQLAHRGSENREVVVNKIESFHEGLDRLE